MYENEVIEQWGGPEEINPDKNGESHYRYRSRGVVVVLSTDTPPIVSLIVAVDKSYATDKGIHVGNTPSEVAKAYGKQDDERGETDRTYLMIYMNLGIVFRIENASDRVEAILILRFE
jgi:hypothetical protein